MRDIKIDGCRTHSWAADAVETFNPDEVLTDEDKKILRTLKLHRKLENIKKELREVYFFKPEQIENVINKNIGDDAYLLEQIVRDVKKQYAKIPLAVPINEYLYDTLMEIEPLDIEKRKQDITSNVHDTLDGQNTKTISLSDFVPTKTFSQEDAWKKMKEYVKNEVQDFFVIHIDKDPAIEKADAEKITSKLIRHYLSQTRMTGMNLYIFVQKDWTKAIAPWIQSWPRGIANDSYFGDLAKKYNATMVTLPLSHFLPVS